MRLEIVVFNSRDAISIVFRGDAQRVRIGAISLKTHDTHVQEIKIANRITHPKYQSKSKYNDIALMKLVQAAALNEHVHPACLNTELNAKWNLAVATGFGRLAYGKLFLYLYLEFVLVECVSSDFQI